MKHLLTIVFIGLVFVGCNSNDSEVTSEVIKNDESKEVESDSLPISKYEIHIDHSCSFDVDLLDTTVYSFASDIEADKALNRIMKLTGLPANFELKSASVPNACAVVKCDGYGNCKRYILYNQEFMENIKSETRTSYAELGVLAHEIGHHLSGHTLSNTARRYDTELEADKFAGFMLYKLGATLKETKQSYSNLPVSGSLTHPPKSARIAAVTSGWYDAKRSGEPISNNNKKSLNSSKSNSNSLSVTKVGAVFRIGDLEFMLQSYRFGDPRNLPNWFEANQACLNLGNGWRLPTRKEYGIICAYSKEVDFPQITWTKMEHWLDQENNLYWTNENGPKRTDAYSLQALGTDETAYIYIFTHERQNCSEAEVVAVSKGGHGSFFAVRSVKHIN